MNKKTVGFMAPVAAVNDYVLKLKAFLKELDPKVLRALARKMATILDKRDKTQTARSVSRLTDEMLPQWLLGIDPKMLLPLARRYGFTPQGKTPAKVAAATIIHSKTQASALLTITDPEDTP